MCSSVSAVKRSNKNFRLIRNCIFLSGLSVFAQLYLFQPMLSELCRDFDISPAMSSLSVSASTMGIAIGLFIFAFKADSLSRTWLMGIALVVSSLLTVLSAFAWNFSALVGFGLLKGMVLSGVSAVALAYLSEEIDASVIGLAISLYLSGNTIGGMSGRVAGTLLSETYGWRGAAIIIGTVCLLLAIVFIKKIPLSKNFHPVHADIKNKLRQMGLFLRTPLFLGLYIIAGLVMGAFVSVYNYLSFILESPRFGLPHYVVAMIYVMYTVGVAGSVLTGKWSDRYGPVVLLRGAVILMIVGIAMMLVMQLWAIVLGLGIMTFAFFSVHTMASRIVAINARHDKSSATCIYWLFYYIGSSFIGSLTGIVLTGVGWNAFIGCILVLVAIAFSISVLSVRRM